MTRLSLETPRTNLYCSVAFSCIVSATTTGCGASGPHASDVPPAVDPEAPVLALHAAPRDSLIPRGEVAVVMVDVSAHSELVAVVGMVTGAVAFRFPVATPNDTLYSATYRIDTRDARGDTIRVRVTATDREGRRGSESTVVVLRRSERSQ